MIVALRLLALVAAAFPFAFGLIRAAETDWGDLRYVWVAAAALAGAVITVLMRGRATTISRTFAVFVSATLFAVLTARILGTVIGPGALIVGGGFAACFTLAARLYARTQGMR